MALRLLALVLGLLLVGCAVGPELQPPSGHRDFTLLAVGDIADCGSPGAGLTADLLDHLEGRVLAVGDLVYPRGSARDFARCYDPSWGRHKERTWPVPGNRDYGTAGAEPYFRYFGARAGGPGGYYSFELPGWHVVALNSNIDAGKGSAQESWLRADLAAARSHCILAFFHHSWASSGWHGRTHALGALVADLYAARTTLVLTGHDHHYERLAPVDAEGRLDPVHGMRFFVVGTGGVERVSTLVPIKASESATSTTWGVLGLDLSPGGYSWEFVPAEPTRFQDAGAGACAR
jgi:hypothetical protein